MSVNRTPVAARVSLQKDKSDMDMFGCGLAHNIGRTTHKGVTLHLNVMTPYMPITSDGKEPNLKPFLPAISAAVAGDQEDEATASASPRPRRMSSSPTSPPPSAR